jgi:hypothetical protein
MERSLGWLGRCPLNGHSFPDQLGSQLIVQFAAQVNGRSNNIRLNLFLDEVDGNVFIDQKPPLAIGAASSHERSRTPASPLGPVNRPRK